MDINDISRKRSILLSARMRFSPETQPIRETAIDKIVEQNLILVDEPLTIKEIRDIGSHSFGDGVPAISRQDLKSALERLIQANRVVPIENDVQKKFTLSEQAREELWKLQTSTEERLTRVVTQLFKNASVNSSRYTGPFLECLCIIFSQLGESYVRLMMGDINRENLLGLSLMTHAIDEITRKYNFVDAELFRACVETFFRNADPDADAIKWNMAQNYYVLKVLGLDTGGRLLSREVFGQAIFYLDTNVIINALEPKLRHFGSFSLLSRACKQLKAELVVCQITLEELRSVVGFYREIIQKVADQIPEKTAAKVQGIFYQLYREQVAEDGFVNLDKVFKPFTSPMPVLEQSFGVSRVDDSWFYEPNRETEEETLVLIDKIRKEYQQKRRRPKSKNSAFHDALLIRWIQSERAEKPNTWLVTLDTTLPPVLPVGENVEAKYIAITLDALIQWMSPITVFEDTIEMATIFSEAVKYRLLPQESYFDVKDFLIFAEMEWSCKELPSEDVEECIRYLKARAPNLDPTTPEAREKLSHEIARFFADPARRYKREVQMLEAEVKKRDEMLAEEREKMEMEKAKEIAEKESQIQALLAEQATHAQKERQATLKKSGIRRFILIVLISVAYEVIIVLCSNFWGEGATLFQKVVNSWPFITIGPGLLILFSWIFVGKERLRALGWPFNRLLKD